jgi:hypothetical protein
MDCENHDLATATQRVKNLKAIHLKGSSQTVNFVFSERQVDHVQIALEFVDARMNSPDVKGRNKCNRPQIFLGGEIAATG